LDPLEFDPACALEIRVENRGDVGAIGRIVARAFVDHPQSDGTESRIVRDLRANGALALSLVALEGGRPIGHVAFSRVTLSDGSRDWFGLAPVSVDPIRQRFGIGAALVRAGLERLRARGAAGCVVFGDPAYYGRFGFERAPGLVYPGGPAEHFQALSFMERMPRAEVAYHAAFGRPGPRRVALVFPGDLAARRAATAENNRFANLFRAFAEAGIAASPAVYGDDFADAVRAQLMAVDAALVWVNPIEDGRDRHRLDALLRDVAEAGVFVSTHPDVILALGTKDVLYRTRDLGWGSDVHRYASLESLRCALPARLAESGPRVLKQVRGQSGHGVFKVELVKGGSAPEATPGNGQRVRVRHALRGSREEEIPFEALYRRLARYFEGDGAMLDQAYQPRLVEGMVRCYLVEGEVVGFGLQAINALHPAPPDSPPGTLIDPGPRLYHPPTLPEWQRLKGLLEREWIPAAQRRLGIESARLPILWDCDFLLGPRDAAGRDRYVLCEINVSSVAPYPDSAVPRIVDAIARRLGVARSDGPG